MWHEICNIGSGAIVLHYPGWLNLGIRLRKIRRIPIGHARNSRGVVCNFFILGRTPEFLSLQEEI